MRKIYKHKNKNKLKVALLFVAQIILGVLPVILLIIFIYGEFHEENKFVSIIFILLMFGCSTSSFYISRRYNILASGLYGEKQLLKTAKKIKGNWRIFANVPVHYKKNRSEIDLFIVSEKGVIIAEVKNHSGIISGHYNDPNWLQKKIYRDGKVTENQFYNPLRQTKLQREILKSIFRNVGIDVWIDSVLIFSSTNLKLKLVLRDNDFVYNDTENLLKFIKDYQPKRLLSADEVKKIANIIKNLD